MGRAPGIIYRQSTVMHRGDRIAWLGRSSSMVVLLTAVMCFEVRVNSNLSFARSSVYFGRSSRWLATVSPR